MMLSSYTPYDVVHHDNPILRREARMFRTDPADPWRLPPHGGVKLATQIAGVMAGLVLCSALFRTGVWRSGNAVMLFFLDTLPALPFVVLTAAQLVVTIGVDLYVAVTTVAFWKARLGTEQWEALRLAPAMDEAQLVDAFHAAAQIRVWRPLWLETTTRLVPVMLFVVGLLFPLPIPLIFGVCLFLAYGGGQGLILLPWVTLFGATLLGYAREPLLKMRANVAICAMFAARLHDTNSATIASVGTILAVRLVLVFGWVLFFMLSVRLELLSAIPALILTVALLPMVAAYYGLIERVSVRRAVWYIRHGE